VLQQIQARKASAAHPKANPAHSQALKGAKKPSGHEKVQVQEVSMDDDDEPRDDFEGFGSITAMV